jgi:thioredoxin reductase-like selenoprotein T
VTGGHYPLPAPRQIASRMVTVAQFSFIALVAAGDRYIFPALNVPPPPWYRGMVENRMATILAAFFGGNVINNSMAQTGAFEVYYDGKLVWSKLQSGQPPNIASILRSLASAAGRR